MCVSVFVCMGVVGSVRVFVCVFVYMGVFYISMSDKCNSLIYLNIIYAIIPYFRVRPANEILLFP